MEETKEALMEETLMEETGLGLLPGLVGALGLVVVAMALLLIGSMWAVFGVLLLVVIVTLAILAVVVALVDEDGETGRRLRRAIPGLGERPQPELKEDPMLLLERNRDRARQRSCRGRTAVPRRAPPRAATRCRPASRDRVDRGRHPFRCAALAGRPARGRRRLRLGRARHRGVRRRCGRPDWPPRPRA